MDNPCGQNCPDRTATCHSTCERYAAFAKWRAEELEKLHERVEKDNALNWGKRKKMI